MKRLLIICLLITTAFGCKEEPKINYTTLSGEIKNPMDKTVIIYHGRDKVKEIPLKEDGTFSDTLKVERGYYSFIHDRENSSIYLEPGYDLKISLNAKEFDETLNYDGNGSENNNYLAKKYLANENLNFDFAEVYSKEEGEFLALMNEVKSSKTELLSSAKNITEEFRALEQKNTEYDYLANLQNYGPAHSYYAKKQDFKPSEDFLKTLEDIDLKNKDDYESIESYKRIVQNHYTSKISNSTNPSEVFKEINKNAFPQLKEDLAKSLKYYIAPNNEYNKAYYEGIIAMTSNDEDFRDELTFKYHKVRKLAKGMPSPQFNEYENHKGGATSLSDLKGKYVYIDVWATWCGPCIAEIPALKEVEKQFHGKNIAFVSTSIDKANDHNTWVEMVKAKELGGMQLMADNDWNSKFVKDYAIEGIPRFILIDPSGNIVSADAPRPSDPKLLNMLNELKI
ncbi:TlpA family protein disulfide reductase [Winogradskyella sp. PE311]|uniref:TlpA family protein disulfide reductase n=1 Tax=Winogradskyella sp. PE311 TaxID=3366943 RepID=UPI00397EAA6F